MASFHPVLKLLPPNPVTTLPGSRTTSATALSPSPTAARQQPRWTAAAIPALLYGVRLWASVCLALFVTFRLELQAPYWAATSAAIVCQPSLGASLRKGGFRLIGTVIGGVAIVLMVAAFPQSRIGFLIALALWTGLCGFGASILRNFAGYAAALAGYTAAIIFADASNDVTQTFTLAVTRASEICVGIVCAGVVLAGTDFGTARRRLAGQLAALVYQTAAGLCATLATASPDFEFLRTQRRDLVLAASRLDTVIDEAVGEASDLRARSLTLQRAVDGLLAALSGWRNVANHREILSRNTLPEHAQQQTAPQPCVPPADYLPSWQVPPMKQLIEAPDIVRSNLLASVRLTLRAETNRHSERLIADRTADALLGLCRALEGLILLGLPRQSKRRGRAAWPRVPDLLPPVLSGLRAAALVLILEAFWVYTGWQGGQLAVTFGAVAITLFAPREEEAYAMALGFSEGTVVAAALAAVVQFAVLPAFEGFAALCAILAVVLVPLAALSTGTWQKSAMIAMTANFVPILAPANRMTYDPAAFLNTALAITAGTTAAAFAMRLFPPLPAATKIARLHRLTLRDFKRLAAHRASWRPASWQSRVYGRILALPAAATPLDSARLLAALSAGEELLRLRGLTIVLDAVAPMRIMEQALSESRLAEAGTALAELRRLLESAAGSGDIGVARAAASVDLLSEILARHGQYLAQAA
jgi:uncharacterized membrane protein YccC